MEINKDRVAKKLLGYLKHRVSVNELVDWCENAIMEGKFKQGEEKILREVVGKLGLADVKTFGLTWEDCDKLMKKLGYRLKIDAIAA